MAQPQVFGARQGHSQGAAGVAGGTAPAQGLCCRVSAALPAQSWAPRGPLRRHRSHVGLDCLPTAWESSDGLAHLLESAQVRGQWGPRIKLRQAGPGATGVTTPGPLASPKKPRQHLCPMGLKAKGSELLGGVWASTPPWMSLQLTCRAQGCTSAEGSCPGPLPGPLHRRQRCCPSLSAQPAGQQRNTPMLGGTAGQRQPSASAASTTWQELLSGSVPVDVFPQGCLLLPSLQSPTSSPPLRRGLASPLTILDADCCCQDTLSSAPTEPFPRPPAWHKAAPFLGCVAAECPEQLARDLPASLIGVGAQAR